MKFYDGTKLLNLLDINKEKPEIYISTSNRSAGKTTFFGKYVIDNFIKEGKKFCLLYRYAYEITDVSDKFFSDLRNLFFPDYIMSQKMQEKDVFAELYLQNINQEEKVPCGYAISLNKADNLKKCSHLLSDVTVILFDEFQSESNTYTPNEIQKFHSIHTSLARGNGKQVRYLPVIMISNFVSLLNPYYTALHISERIQENTNYLRGEGYVLEQGFNDSASKAQKESAFNRAFGDTSYNKFSSEKFYLNDNNTFVKKMASNGKYVFSFRHNEKWFGVRWYSDTGILYVNKSPDLTHPIKYASDTANMTSETILFTTMDARLLSLRTRFEQGSFRFSDLESKSATFSLLSYR